MNCLTRKIGGSRAIKYSDIILGNWCPMRIHILNGRIKSFTGAQNQLTFMFVFPFFHVQVHIKQVKRRVGQILPNETL
jgi:hypothetical protein